MNGHPSEYNNNIFFTIRSMSAANNSIQFIKNKSETNQTQIFSYL